MAFFIVIYLICAILLALYGVNCHVMIHLFKRWYRQRVQEDQNIIAHYYNDLLPKDSKSFYDSNDLPKITTQLPIYNEFNVAERLIDAVAHFIYPTGKHDIQVLDDSCDETRTVIARKVAKLQAQGVRIKHIVRDNRRGFKAGALRHGLRLAEGNYLAIFDADFVPPPDFLVKAIPFFKGHPQLGFIQARWGHLNRKEGLITKLQSIGIDGHFMVEQLARNAGNLFMNFNGTAGIFRKQAILDAGNWQDDTLTEDMDLSYRIQLKGWHCRYLINLVAPAEIPSDINAFKNQQYRWAKGSIQTAIKLLPAILSSPTTLFTKIQAVMHLTHYLIHPLMLILATMALPILAVGQLSIPGFLCGLFGIILILSCTGPSRLYWAAESSLKRSGLDLILLLPLMICFGCGLAINNTKAVVEALLGRKSSFIRTPKRGLRPKKNYQSNWNLIFVLEILIGLWCMLGMVFYFRSNLYIVGHFLLLYAIGFLLIGILSWWHHVRH